MLCALDAKDPDILSHCRRVSRLGEDFARHVGLDEQTCHSISRAGWLHDVGKIGIRCDVLWKPTSLDRAESLEIRHHSRLGYEMLRAEEDLSDEALIVLHHHERWDGQGYPYGLSGSDIPLGARVLQIVDAIDAMLMPRRYKMAYPMRWVRAELDRCAGRQFDPELSVAAGEWTADLAWLESSSLRAA